MNVVKSTDFWIGVAIGIVAPVVIAKVRSNRAKSS